MTEEECCPQFDPTTWDSKEITWQEKLFIQDSMPQFLHIPIFGGFGKVVTRMQAQIEKNSANVSRDENLMLSYDSSPWKSQLLIAVSKEVPEAQNVKLSGTFLTKVFDGPYSKIPSWMKEMTEFVEAKGKKINKLYFYYTTCPKCAKKWGHNYVVLFAQV